MKAASRALSGRVALVTGASRGIGRAIAAALTVAGARTYCLARPGPKLQETVSSLGELAVSLPCDLSSAADVDRAVDTLRRDGRDPVDLLVQNAGLFVLAPVAELRPDEFARVMETNVVGHYRLLHALLPAMRERSAGHVVTIGSVADHAAYPENAAYAASKFAARGLHQVLREELRGSGVRVSLVSPGPVDTGMWDPVDPDHRPGFTSRSRMLGAAAVADAVLFVVTRAADANIDEVRLSRS